MYEYAEVIETDKKGLYQRGESENMPGTHLPSYTTDSLWRRN